MSRYKLIIFDLDDTLFDYEQTEKQAVTKACANLGINNAPDLYFQYKNANRAIRDEYKVLTPENIQIFRVLRARKFFSLINQTEVSPENFVEEYLRLSTVGVLIEDVRETLEELHGVCKVVATNGTNYPRKNKLDGSAIAKYFNAFFSAESLGIDKSNAEYFVKILQQYNVKKDEVLIVGDDMSNDIQSALKIGTDCCWFNYRQETGVDKLPDGVHVITRFKELIPIVKGDSYG